MRRFLDSLWLLAIGMYVFLGMPLASFHGDETNHIFNSNDYAILFINKQPQDLLIPSQKSNASTLDYQRLLDSGVSRYTIGLAWHLAGITQADLPSDDYKWDKTYDQNVALGLVPPPAALNVYRTPSTLFLALSVAVVFLIGKLFGGRLLAYLLSALYAFNPIQLLNGRRAMQEGSLLFFGLLTVYFALRITGEREASHRTRIFWWIGLISSGALTLASKNSGFIYLAAAYLIIFIPIILSHHPLAVVLSIGQLAFCAILTLLLFIAISPGLWNDPPARIQDMIGNRVLSIIVQIESDPNAPTTLDQRALDIIRQPFMMPVQHYEVMPIRGSREPSDRIDAYMRSPLSGIQFGWIIGGVLTLMGFAGLIINSLPRLRLNPSWSLAIGLYIWLAVNIVVLMATPLPWQRYSLSLIPVVSLFASIGFASLVQKFRRTWRAQLRHVQAPD